jgi:chromosome segregation ATPase
MTTNNTHQMPGFRELLDCGQKELARIFRRFLDQVVKGTDHAAKEEAREMLMMMEGAPELREKVQQIRVGIQKDMEDGSRSLKNLLAECKNNKADSEHRLQYLKTQYRELSAEKNAKEEKRGELGKSLEDTRKQVQEIKNSERRQWMDTAQQWDKRIKQEKNKLEKIAKQWDTKKEKLSTFCSAFKIKQETQNES